MLIYTLEYNSICATPLSMEILSPIASVEQQNSDGPGLPYGLLHFEARTYS